MQPTRARGHATELARDAVATGATAVYVFSGDGGFNEVLNGIDGVDPGRLPPGRWHERASAGARPPSRPVAAAAAIAPAMTRRISLGRVNGRRFGFNAGIGFDAELVRRVDALGRRPDGRRPGDLASPGPPRAWSPSGARATRRALELEGLGRAAFALVANCDPYTYVGGSRRSHVAPLARFELGLDVVAPRSVRARDLPRLRHGTRPRHKAGCAATDMIYGHDLDRLDDPLRRPMPLQVDGEDIGDVTEVLVECERDAVTVFV